MFLDIFEHGVDAGLRDQGVLRGSPRAAADGADDLAIHDDGNAARDVHEAAVVAAVQAERGAAGPDVLLVDRRRGAVAGGREGLVHGDVDRRQLGAGHPLEVQQVQRRVDDGDVHRHADFSRFLQCRGRRDLGCVVREVAWSMDGCHGWTLVGGGSARWWS